MRWRRRILIRLLIVAVIIAVLVAGAAIWLYRALPRIAAAEIGRLMNARVETGAFYPHRDGSVTVAGLVIRPKQEQSLYDNTILRADHVYAKFSRRSLLSLSPRVTAIGIEDFMLDVQLDLNTGQWNIGSLRFNAPRGGGGDVPVIRLVRGKLRYCKISGIEQEVVMSIPVEVQFGRDAEGKGAQTRDSAFGVPNPGYSFEIRTSKLSGGYGESRLSGHWRPCLGSMEPGELTVAGGLSSTDIPSLERAWAIDVLAGVLQYGKDGKYSLDLSMKDLHGKHAPEVDMLRFIAPTVASGSGPLESLRKFFAEYQPTGTVGSITIKARGNTKKLNDSEVEGKLVCKDISVCDSEFPYRLDHLTGELEFTQSTMGANRLVGKHGPVEVCIDGWTKGIGGDRQYRYRITSRNMLLDKALYAALDPNQKRLWDAFRPTGSVSVDYRLTRASPTDHRLYLSVDLNDVTAAFQGFPYPLVGLTGNLFFDQDSVALTGVVSKAAGRQIRVSGKVTERSGGKPVYYISIDAKDIPLDATLRDALPAWHRELCSRFDVNGLADIRARVFTVDDANEVAQSPSGKGVSGSPTQNSALGVPVSPLLAPSGAIPAANPGLALRSPGRDILAMSAIGGPNNVGFAGSKASWRVSFLADVSCKKGSLKLISAWRGRPALASRGPLGLAQPDPGAPVTTEVQGQDALATKVQGQDALATPSVEGSPLVVSNITAEVTITPDSMSIRKLDGRHGRSPVAMTGGVLFGEGNKPGSGPQVQNSALGSGPPTPNSALGTPSPSQTRSVAFGGPIKQYRMRITAQQVPLDETTIGLLPPAMASQAAAFHPEGDVNLVVDLRKADSNEPPEYTVVMDCLGNKVRHERFPYPLQEVRGTVTLAKNSIVLKNVTAKPQDGGQMTADGGQTTGDGEQKMEDSGQKTDGVAVPRPPSSVLRIDGSATLARGTLETGSFSLKATDMLFTENLGRALPKTLAGLYRELSPRGPFDLDLTMLKVSQGASDEALVEFGGTANLGSGPQVPYSALGSPSQPPSIAVGGPLKTCNLTASGAAVELAGTLEVEGSYGTQHGFSKGHARLAAERLVVKGKAVTHTNIDAIYDPNVQKWTAESFVGDCYGGKLLGRLQIGRASPVAEERRAGTHDLPASSGLEYQLQMVLNDVDLQQFLMAGGRPENGEQRMEERELLSSVLRSSSSASSGTMDASLSLRTRLGDTTSGESHGRTLGEGSSRRGVCHIDVENMRVGKVSPLGNVLSVLRLSEPTDYAFERMLIDAYIRADKLLISKLDLSGKSAAFTGSGTMDLPTEEINLTLTARGQRVAAAGPSVLQSLTEGLGVAVVRMEVTGKADSPHIQTKALPVIEDSLRILGTPEEGKKGRK